MLRQAVTVVGLYATVVAPTSFQSTHSLLWGDGYSYEDSIYLNGSLHGGVDVQATTQPPPWQEAGLAQLRVGSRGAVVAGVTTEGKFIYYVQSWVQSEVGEGLTAAHYAYIVEGVAGATSLAVSNEGGIVAVGTEDRHVHVFVCEAGKRPTLLFKISVDRDVSGSTTGRMTWSGVTPPTGPIRDVSLSGAGNVLAIAHDWFVSVFTLRCVAQPSAQLYPKKPLYGFTESFQGRDGTASVVTNLHLSPSHTDVAVYTHDGAVHVVPLAASAPESVADSLGCDVAYYNEGSDYVLHSGVARNCGEVCRETRDCTGYQYSGEVCLLWLNENCHSEGAAGLERQPGSGRTTWLQLAFSYHATAVLRGSTATQAFSATCRPGTPYSADCADNVGTPPPLSQRADLAFTTPSRNVGQPRTAGAVLNILSRMSSRMYAVRVRPDFTTSYHELTARATHPVLALSGASSVSEVWTVQHITTEETTNTLRVIVAIQAYTVGEQDAVQNYTQHFPDAGEEVVFTFDTTNFVATTTRYLDDATASIPLVSMAATLDTYIKGSAEPCSIALHAEDSAGAFEWRTPGVPTSCPRQSPVVGGGGESYAERYRARDIYQVNETWCTAVPRLRYSDRQRFPAELYCVPPMPPIGEGYVCIDHARGLDGSDFCDVGLECFVPAGSRLGRCQAPHSTHIAAHIASTTHASSIAVAVTINGKHHAIKLFSALRDPIPHVPQASTMPCSSEHHNVSMTHLCRNGKQCKGVRCCNDEGGVLRCPPQQPELCGAFVCSDHCEASGSGLPYQCHTAFAYDKVTNYDMTHEHLTYGTTRGIQCPPGMTPIDTQTGCQTAHRLLLLGLPYNLTASHSAQEAMNLPMCYYAEQPLGVHYNMRGTTGPLVERWRGGVVQPLCMSTQYVRLAPSVSCDTVRLPQQPLYPIRSAATCREAVATLNTYNAESLSARSMRYYESSVGSLYPVGCYERLGGVSFKADARTATHPAPQEGMHAICSLKPTLLPPPIESPPPSLEPPPRTDLIYPHAALYAVMFGLLGLLSWVGLIFAVRHSGVAGRRNQRRSGHSAQLDSAAVEVHKQKYLCLLNDLITTLDSQECIDLGQCSVCLEPLGNEEDDSPCIRLPACGHCLHHACMADYVVHFIENRRRRTPRCPNCRTKLLLQEEQADAEGALLEGDGGGDDDSSVSSEDSDNTAALSAAASQRGGEEGRGGGNASFRSAVSVGGRGGGGGGGGARPMSSVSMAASLLDEEIEMQELGSSTAFVAL